jgi:hypothetical protein
MEIREKYLTLINLKPQKGDLLKFTTSAFGETKTVEGRFVRFIKGYTVLKTTKKHVKVNVSKMDTVEVMERSGQILVK